MAESTPSSSSISGEAMNRRTMDGELDAIEENLAILADRQRLLDSRLKSVALPMPVPGLAETEIDPPVTATTRRLMNINQSIRFAIKRAEFTYESLDVPQGPTPAEG